MDVSKVSETPATSPDASPEFVHVSRQRRRHVAFAAPPDSDEENEDEDTLPRPQHHDEGDGNKFVEDEYYVEGPGNEPILHHADHGPAYHSAQHDKMSARRKSMQVMDNFLTEHEGILKMELGAGLFGPKVAIDTNAVRRKIFNQKRPSVFQHMARFHHKFGVRHYVLVGLLTLYSAFGGLIFLKLESENEIQNLEATRHTLIKMIETLSEDIFEITNATVTPVAREDVILLIQDYYREMLKTEGKYTGSVMHKYERINMRLTWSYGSAVFFAMTLFTTIGYGTIAAQTVEGKIFTIIYAIIGIPLMLVVLSDVGRILLRVFTKLYNYARQGIRHVISFLMKLLLNREYRGMRDEKEFPLFLSIPIVIGYLLLCGFFVTLFDYHDGITPGLSTGDAMYFSFISMSTIGLGDVMPNNIEYSPLLSFMFLFGLALLSVVNSTVYEKMERKFLYSVDKLESWLENVHFYRHGREGYATFKSLGSNMQLLALALPIFDEDEEDHIEASLEPGSTNLGQRLFSRPRTRTNSLIDEKIEAFRPVLGIFSGASRKKRANTFDGTCHEENDPVDPGQSGNGDSRGKVQSPVASEPSWRVRRVQSDRIPGNQRIIPAPEPRLRTISELV